MNADQTRFRHTVIPGELRSGNRTLALWLPFPRLDKNERLSYRRNWSGSGRPVYLHPVARLYRAQLSDIITDCLPERPWFRGAWSFDAVFISDGAWDWDHGHWITDDLVKAGVARDDAGIHRGQLGRTFTKLVGPPAAVWLVAQEEEVEEAWPTSLWR